MPKKVIKPATQPLSQLKPGTLFNFPFRSKCIFLAIVGFVFYANSILNKYALDDVATITRNAYVQKGFSGIPNILTHDSYTGFYTYTSKNSSGQLSAGRYRPLSEIVFAIEQQLFGGSSLLPYLRHLINVLTYITCIIAIFYFLENFLFKKIPRGSDMAFTATFLFAIHPLHTEVVANIKSLDEILSLLFIILTFIYSLTYSRERKVKYLVTGLGSFLFALLSKEYAAALLFFIPFLFYLLEGKRFNSAILAGIPYYGVFALYLLLRYNAVGFHGSIPNSHLLTNPYLYATYAQKSATEWFVLGKYLELLFFPYPLSADYSYNQIPYHSFSDMGTLIPIFIFTGIFIRGVMLALKRNVLSFAVFFFLFNMLIISNFVLGIGATMGERLVFHSSLGFVIILSYYLFQVIFRKGLSGVTITFQTQKRIITGVMLVMGAACFGETLIRNAQWKDDTTLFIHDVNVAPNSFLVNNYAAAGYLSLSKQPKNTLEQANSYLDSAHKYSLMALHFNPGYEASYVVLGYVYFQQGDIDSLKYCLDKAKKINPYFPGLDSNYALLGQLYLNKGIDLGNEGKVQEGINYMKKALLVDSLNANIWYNIGVAYFRNQQFDSAQYALVKTLQYKPDNTDARKGLDALLEMKK